MHDEKLERLEGILGAMGRVLVAFSGGVDSTFLLKVASDVLGDNVLAVTAESEIQLSDEMRDAVEVAKTLGVTHIKIRTDEMQDEAFLANPPDRCYICKKKIFSGLKDLAATKGIPCIVDGSNADDAGDYRPGMRALRELSVRSPLREAGLTKEEIRSLSKEMGLPTWNKPALACLASRIPYDTMISSERLRRIDGAESFLREAGLHQVRVRDHESVARIEVGRDERAAIFEKGFAERIVQHLKLLGYQYVALDLEGYRTGSMNEAIKTNG